MTSTTSKTRLSSIEDKLDMLMIQLDRNEQQMIKLFDVIDRIKKEEVVTKLETIIKPEPKTITKKPSTKKLVNT